MLQEVWSFLRRYHRFLVLWIRLQQSLSFYYVEIVLHALVLWQNGRWILECSDSLHLLFFAVVVTAQVHSLLTVELLLWDAIRARVELVVERTEQLFNKGVAVLAVQVVRALVPVSIFLHVGTLFKRTDEVVLRRPPEVLLPVGVVAVGPLVFLVDHGTEAGLVSVDHELLETHLLLKGIQVLREPLLSHQRPDGATLLGAERKRVNLLLLLVQRLYSLLQVAGVEGVQLVRRRQLTIDYHKWTVEVGRAVDFELISERVSREPITVALQEQDVQTDVVS